MTRLRGVGVGLALLFFAACLALTKTKPESWNDMSHVAAIESQVERGTWAIDGSAWADQTEDKVLFRGNFYSGKMPLLSWIGAGIYAVLHNLFGLGLEPDCATAARGCAYYWLTLIMMGLPASLLVGLFYDFARQMQLPVVVGLIGTAAVGAGTMVLPYSMVLNHDLPAAVALFAAFYLLVTRARQDARWLLGVGFCAAFAAACDPMSGLLAVGFFLIAAARFRLRALYFVLGALPPLLLTVWLDFGITHTFLPPYLVPSGYNYPGSSAGSGPARSGSADDLAQYAFKMFLGAQGLFAYDLALFFALAGIVIVALTRGHRLRLEALVVGAAFLGLSLYNALRTGNLGGVAYGERFFIQSVPTVTAFILFAPPLAARHRLLALPFFAVALTLSILSAYQGALHPWVYVQPPVHLTRDAATGAIGWRWNLRFPLR